MQLSVNEFADRVNEIIPLIMSRFRSRKASELFGRITLPQFCVLNFLFSVGESKTGDLARVLNVTTPAVTGIVDRLVRSGYIRRIPSQEDRRIVKVQLTPKGEELIKKLIQQRREMIIRVFSDISEHDRHDYLRVLTKVKESMTKTQEVS